MGWAQNFEITSLEAEQLIHCSADKYLRTRHMNRLFCNSLWWVNVSTGIFIMSVSHICFWGEHLNSIPQGSVLLYFPPSTKLSGQRFLPDTFSYFLVNKKPYFWSWNTYLLADSALFLEEVSKQGQYFHIHATQKFLPYFFPRAVWFFAHRSGQQQPGLSKWSLPWKSTKIFVLQHEAKESLYYFQETFSELSISPQVPFFSCWPQWNENYRAWQSQRFAGWHMLTLV